MYAIIETGGKQYTVQIGDTLYVEKLNLDDDDNVTFDVLMYADDDDIRIGTPKVEGVEVKAKAVRHVRGKKIYVVHYKAKKDIRKKNGHRQPYTQLEITDIVCPAV